MCLYNWAVLFCCGFGYMKAMDVSIHFNSSPESTTVGSKVKLSCHIEGDDMDYSHRVYMMRNGTLICNYKKYYCDRSMFSYSSLINEYYYCECDFFSKKKFLNLTIKKTRKEDNTVWVCDMTSIKKSLSLKVKYPPSINTIKMIPDDRGITEGTYVKLSCLVDSYPQSNLSWTFNGVKMKNKDQDVIISNATCEDSGSYTCWAENGVGSRSLATRKLEVPCVPRLERSPNKIIWAPLAGSVFLTATVISYPFLTFTWKRLSEDQSEEFIMDQRIKTTSIKVTSYLHITDITEQDFGDYIMYAKNTEGEISVVFTLKEVRDVDDVSPYYGTVDSDNKLGRGIGIGFIIGLLVLGVILAIAFFIWKKRRGKGINLKKLKLQYIKKSTAKRTPTTETAQSTGQTSSPAPNTTAQSAGQTSSSAPNTTAQSASSTRPNTTEESAQMYEGLDMNNSPQPTYEQINIYENYRVVA